MALGEGPGADTQSMASWARLNLAKLMALRVVTRALGSLSLTPRIAAVPGPSLLPAAQVIHLSRECSCFHSGRSERAHV